MNIIRQDNMNSLTSEAEVVEDVTKNDHLILVTVGIVPFLLSTAWYLTTY